MPSDRVSRLLDEFSAVTSAAPRPESHARRMTMRNRMPVATLTGATLVIVVVAVAAIVLGQPGPSATVGSSPSAPAASSAPSAPASVTAVASPSVPAVASPSVTPAPSSRPTVGPCDPASLAARIKSWEGAAGSRIANVSLVNGGPVACLFEARNHPQLVDGRGVLIDGRDPATTPVLTLEPGATVTTIVSAANYCGAPPVPPVSVAFVLGDGRRIVAEPAEASDEAVPPCNGPGQPGTIEMHPWAP
jgi:hypothetical protein